MWMIPVATTLDSRMSLFHMPFRKESGAENMATDMWLLAQATSWGGPAFRRYGWARPQITFGYGQKADWVEQETGQVVTALTRRPTGGGIVRHGTDLTYCLILPRASRGEQMSPMEFYGLLHQCWGEALEEQSIANCLMPCSQTSRAGIPGDCFQEPVGRDLMDHAGVKKIGGAAMKRTRQGTLIQGSLELGDWPGLDHEQIEGIFLQRMATNLGEPIAPREWPSELATERMDFVHSYRSLSWTKERKNSSPDRP